MIEQQNIWKIIKTNKTFQKWVAVIALIPIVAYSTVEAYKIVQPTADEIIQKYREKKQDDIFREHFNMAPIKTAIFDCDGWNVEVSVYKTKRVFVNITEGDHSKWEWVLEAPKEFLFGQYAYAEPNVQVPEQTYSVKRVMKKDKIVETRTYFDGSIKVIELDMKKQEAKIIKEGPASATSKSQEDET